MSRPLALALLLAAAPAAPAAEGGAAPRREAPRPAPRPGAAPTPRPADAPPPDGAAASPELAPQGAPSKERGFAASPELVASFRFAWPPEARARVTHRRTRVRTGAPRGIFVARYEAVAEPAPEGGLRLSTRKTSWRGDLPFPAALAKDAIRASQRVVQRIGPDGEFLALDGVEALRPVLGRVLDRARIPADQAERAIALALAGTEAEAEELWNLAVGFWTGADLPIGETYAMSTEGELPLLPGVRAVQAVEFRVRRRVPCAAGERGERCVEVVLRSTPDRAAVERAAPALLARLLPAGAEAPAGAAKGLAAESELLLVTDPATLLPRRLVWTKALRLGAREDGPPDAELVDRAEYDWRWLPKEPPRRKRPARAKRTS